MEQGGSGSDQANAERRLKEAGEARSVLELFKKNLNGYVRFYEFVSQITPSTITTWSGCVSLHATCCPCCGKRCWMKSK